MAREDEPIQGPRSAKELEEALGRLYTGRYNVAIQAQGLNMPLERLKQVFNRYVADRPLG